MPKVVDHPERRRELAQAALRVIGRGGLESATTRAIAEESGWSTGVLKHYYADKDELLHDALRELERRNVRRLEAAQREETGFEAIRAAIAEILRSDPSETRVWIAFTARASTDRTTASSMSRAIDSWVARWADLVRRGQADGSVRSDVQAEDIAVEIHALVNGLRIRDHFRTARARRGSSVVAASSTLVDGLRHGPSARPANIRGRR